LFGGAFMKLPAELAQSQSSEAPDVQPGHSDPAARVRRNWPGQTLAVIGVVLSLLYLSNVGAGFLELIPDNLPGIGNIDEVAFTMILIYCLRRLGIDLAPHLRSRLTPDDRK
jgi:hypothetical protein